MQKYEKPTVTTFDEEALVKTVDEIKVSGPPPSAWSCVRG